MEEFSKIKNFSFLYFEGGDFTYVYYENFKEKYHCSEHKYIIRGGGGGKKQSDKDKTKTIKSIGS